MVIAGKAKDMFFLSSHSKVQIMLETIRPPIHNPEIESSTPSHLQRPMPVVTAIVQTGQTAKALPAERMPDKIKTKNIFFFIVKKKPCASKIGSFRNYLLSGYSHVPATAGANIEFP